MAKRSKTAAVGLFLVALFFVLGTARLFVMRFETGDVYPLYSSLRADPLGTKALYAGLENLPGLSVSRNERPLTKLGEGKGTALLFLGAETSAFSFLDKREVAALENFLSGGGRIVISFLPPKGRGRVPETGKKKDDADGKEPVEEGQVKDKKASDGEKEREKPKYFSLRERWTFGLSSEPLGEEQAGKNAAAALVPDLPGLPAALSWHAPLSFTGAEGAWNIIYAVSGKPVVIERAFGKGSVVLSADVYHLSNEAMVRERHPGFLAWLVGEATTVIFDETVHGIQENPGIASLTRKYGLHGLFAGIVLLCLLAVWKNSASLVPPRTDDAEREGDGSAGRDHLSGFVGLLRRNIPGRNILALCFDEWKKSARLRPGARDDEEREVRSIIEKEQNRPMRQRDPAAAYRAVSTFLSERKKKSL